MRKWNWFHFEKHIPRPSLDAKQSHDRVWSGFCHRRLRTNLLQLRSRWLQWWSSLQPVSTQQQHDGDPADESTYPFLFLPQRRTNHHAGSWRLHAGSYYLLLYVSVPCRNMPTHMQRLVVLCSCAILLSWNPTLSMNLAVIILCRLTLFWAVVCLWAVGTSIVQDSDWNSNTNSSSLHSPPIPPFFLHVWLHLRVMGLGSECKVFCICHY